MSKEGKDKVFNILYWNINNAAGYRPTKSDAEEKIAVEIINERIRKEALLNEIHCFIFVEAYNDLEKKLGPALNSQDRKYIFFGNENSIDDKKQNPVAVITASGYEFKYIKQGINFVHVKNVNKLNIIGYRTMYENAFKLNLFNALKSINKLYKYNVISSKENYNYEVFKKEIEEFNKKYENAYECSRCDYEKVFMKKDMRNSSVVEHLKNTKIGKMCLYDEICEMKAKTEWKDIIYKLQINSILEYVNKIKDEKVIIVGDFNISTKSDVLRQYYKIDRKNYEEFIECENYTIMQDKLDYLYLIGCKKKEFKVILEMPKFYFNDIPIIQNNCGNMLKINPPFPDHNLLFASIDLGSG